MGYVRVRGILGNARRTVVKEVVFLADTGTFFTTVPTELAKELQIEPIARTSVTLADGRTVEADVSLAYLKILDREGILPVQILDSPEPLLGATALEGLGLKVNPATGQVEHSRPYGLATLGNCRPRDS